MLITLNRYNQLATFDNHGEIKVVIQSDEESTVNAKI